MVRPDRSPLFSRDDTFSTAARAPFPASQNPLMSVSNVVSLEMVLAPRSATTLRSSMPAPAATAGGLRRRTASSAPSRRRAAGPQWRESRAGTVSPGCGADAVDKADGLSASIARASSWSSAAKPRGLSRSEAIFAKNLLQDRPTDTVMPMSRSTSRAKRASTFAWIRCRERVVCRPDPKTPRRSTAAPPAASASADPRPAPLSPT